jgi:hypothetical protein
VIANTEVAYRLQLFVPQPDRDNQAQDAAADDRLLESDSVGRHHGFLPPRSLTPARQEARRAARAAGLPIPVAAAYNAPQLTTPGGSTMRFLLCLAALAVAAPAHAQTEKLFNGKDFAGWKLFLDPKKSAAKTDEIFRVKEGVIHIDGSVNGYMITEKEYENYKLTLEWRWGEKITRGRNSGVFVHVSGPDQIWPKSVEAQLMAGFAGDIWLVGGYKLDVDAKRQDPKQARHFFRYTEAKEIEKPIGEWNKYEIVCQGDTITLIVNGKEVNKGTKAESTKGKILLQSEGAEIYFRNIELTPLK